MWDRTATVLLVEDDSVVRRVVRRVLERMKCNVLEAGNAAEALKIAQESLDSVDILLVDLILPGKINGHQLAIQLQSRRPELHLIFTSGYDTTHFDEEIHLVEGKNFLSKPYTADQLQNILASIYSRTSEKLTSPSPLPTLGVWQNRS